MTSGIYKLTFKSGHYYVGKSKDIERRWKEHCTKFEKGTAARNMQEAFNQAGYPSHEILYEAHPDHIDVIEPIAISNHWGPGILNTTREAHCEELLERHLPYCKYSLAAILLASEQQVEEIAKLKETLANERKRSNKLIKDIKKGTELERVETALQASRDLCMLKDIEINRMKNCGFINRILGWK